MTTTLSEGVKVPDVGSTNWAGDLEVNWNLLNGALANLSGNVKLDRDNTWTGEQSFTLPIAGSITGTASKAIADEDGTSIKTGYVNIAGDQTVTGQKTWTATQTVKGAPPALNLQSTNIQRGVAPASNSNINLYGKDLNGAELCRLIYRASPTGERRLWLGVNDDYLNGAIDPTGTSTWNSLNLYLRADGKAETTFSADLLPATNNAYNFGSSSYQWSSVYAQSYYYNGTAWGLDKSNVWTNGQTYSTDSYGQMIWLKNTGLDFSVNGNTGLSSTCQHMIHWCDKNNAIYSSIQSWTASSENTLVLRSYYRTDANTVRDLSVRFTSTATNKVVYPETNADTELGTSTNKWKTLNGINPGALSLPDLNKATTIDTTGWDLTGNSNSYTPQYNGYIVAVVKDTAGNAMYMSQGGMRASASGTGVFSSLAGGLCCSMPVTAGTAVSIRVVAPAITIRFIPCLGNV